MEWLASQGGWVKVKVVWAVGNVFVGVIAGECVDTKLELM